MGVGVVVGKGGCWPLAKWMRSGRRPDPLCAAAIVWCVTTLACPVSAQAIDVVDAHAHYRIRASVSVRAPHIDGTVDVTFTNTSTHTLDEAVFILFANRF